MVQATSEDSVGEAKKVFLTRSVLAFDGRHHSSGFIFLVKFPLLDVS